jgi:hypothetical protein
VLVDAEGLERVLVDAEGRGRLEVDAELADVEG